MFLATHKGITYQTDCDVFRQSIERGQSQPYPNCIHVIERFKLLYPDKNRTYVDVGAHIGSTILPLASYFKKIYGYEPNPRNWPFLQANIKNNGATNVVIKNLAVSDREYTGVSCSHNGGLNSGMYFFKEQEGGDFKTVLLDNEGIEDLDYIKCDVEGNELSVLKGAKRLIEKYKPFIQLEINGLSSDLFNISDNEIFQYMKSLGYEIFDKADNDYFFYYPDRQRIFCFWTGSNQMSQTREDSITQLKEESGCDVVLVTPDNLSKYILFSNPLHEAYQYLSQVHKADYLRTYFMHFYGGGYTDIKKTTGSWVKGFQDMETSPEMLINSYKEAGPNCIAHPEYTKYWEQLPGNCAYIVKPRTQFTTEWYNSMISLLDLKLQALRSCPAKNPRDCKETGSGYPIEWNEMLGRIFHPISYKYRERILFTVPPCVFSNYQ